MEEKRREEKWGPSICVSKRVFDGAKMLSLAPIRIPVLHTLAIETKTKQVCTVKRTINTSFHKKI